jgi:hypothetical protein
LQTSNFNVSGNIGIGGTGTYHDAGGCSGQCIVNGVVEFSAAQSGGFLSQFTSSSGTTYTPAVAAGVNPLYGVSDVGTAVTNLNNLDTTLGGLSTSNAAFTLGGASNQTINLGTTNFMPNTSGAGSGIVMLNTTVSSFNQTLTINGDAAHDAVVFNITASPHISGTITLGGGLTPDQVVFNLVGAGLTLQFAANGDTQMADFIDPGGTITANSVDIEGRLFGGDSANFQFVSGANITAPPSETPLPAALALFASGLGAFGLLGWRRKRKAEAVA